MTDIMVTTKLTTHTPEQGLDIISQYLNALGSIGSMPIGKGHRPPLLSKPPQAILHPIGCHPNPILPCQGVLQGNRLAIPSHTTHLRVRPPARMCSRVHAGVCPVPRLLRHCRGMSLQTAPLLLWCVTAGLGSVERPCLQSVTVPAAPSMVHMPV